MSKGNTTQDALSDRESGRHDNPTEKVGLVIDGRYRITSLIGRGGMGSVYKAEHVATRRTVALKLLHPTLAQVPEVSKRFQREAFAIGRIQHENCVDVSDFGELEDGSLFLVMEYLDGVSLGTIIDKEGRVEWRRALHIIRHVLRGLGHAHQADIVHRDVKPENVIVSEIDGDPNFAKILDFGIAKLIGEAKSDGGGEVKLTQAGVAFGTPIYMSPEQAVGNPVDGRADLYAAAILLFEMLAGKPPFYSEDKLEVLSMHTTRPVPRLREINKKLSKIPPVVEDLIMRGLTKRPDDRFADADAFIAAIDEILEAPDPTARTAVPRATDGTVPVLYSGSRTRATTLAGKLEEEEHRRKLFWVLGGIGGLVVIAVLAALIVGGGSNKPGKGTPVQRAGAKLERGDAAGAIKILTKNKKKLAKDAEAQLLFGHAYSAQRAHDKAILAYQRAKTLDGALRDATMIQNLRVLLEGKSGELAVSAARFLIKHLDDDDARKALIAMPSAWKWSFKSRHQALKAAESLQLIDKVDLFETYKIDLAQPSRCKTRLKAVAKLRLLEDRRAIEPLQEAIKRRGKSGRYKGKKINGCLKAAAEEAIKFLEALPYVPR